jgi:hypothetical protein
MVLPTDLADSIRELQNTLKGGRRTSDGKRAITGSCTT